jgi:hypothetical protein
VITPKHVVDRVEQERARLNQIRVTLAELFLSRAEAQGYRDNKTGAGRAIEFYCGAASAAKAMGDKAAADYLTRLALLVAIRGLAEVRQLAKAEPGS